MLTKVHHRRSTCQTATSELTHVTTSTKNSFSRSRSRTLSHSLSLSFSLSLKTGSQVCDMTAYYLFTHCASPTLPPWSRDFPPPHLACPPPAADALIEVANLWLEPRREEEEAYGMLSVASSCYCIFSVRILLFFCLILLTCPIFFILLHA